MSCGNSFTSSFLIWVPFISFLAWLSQLDNTMLRSIEILSIIEEVARVDILLGFLKPCLSPLAMGFFTDAVRLKKFLFIPNLFSFFKSWKSMKYYLMLFFFCICWDVQVVLILYFFNAIYQINWLTDVELSLQAWDKSHSIIVYNSFNILLNFWLILCLEFLNLCSSGILAYNFLIVSWSGSAIRVMLTSENKIISFFFLQEFKKDWH